VGGEGPVGVEGVAEWDMMEMVTSLKVAENSWRGAFDADGREEEANEPPNIYFIFTVLAKGAFRLV